jgi:uncharacterized protein YkwD
MKAGLGELDFPSSKRRRLPIVAFVMVNSSQMLRSARPWRMALSLAVWLVVLVAPGVAHAGAEVTGPEWEQVQLINEYRARRGAPALVIDTRLTAAAQWMASSMASNGFFDHQDNLGRDPFERLDAFGYPSNTWRGENLAAGYPDAPSTFTQWRESPGHNENMLNPNYRAIGIALVERKDSQYGHYWVTEFGSNVTSRVPSQAEQSRLSRYTPAQRGRIKRVARSCRRVSRSSATFKRRKCAWNMRTAQRLSAAGL